MPFSTYIISIVTQSRGLSPDFIEQVKLSSNIVQVASRYIPLKAKGKQHWGLCPFHHEKTPSFAINEQQQYFKCFGCGASGNVITLIKQLESTDFLGALELLAKWANMAMPTVTADPYYTEKKKKKDRVLEALEIAKNYYCETLYTAKAKPMLDYLYSRGLSDELIKLFNIGASTDWENVIKHLRQKGFNETEIFESGVAAKNERGNLYDAMGNRITFAIFDVYSSCIGFTGRTMSDDKEVAKYRNTGQTIVFDKSNIVYGLDVLKKNKLSNFVEKLIVVEGNVDVITLVGAGFPGTVACMGTAMTSFHARVFRRFSTNIYLCFDGDKAGQAAALKSLDILDKEGLAVRVVRLPKDTDPDSFVTKNGKDAFQALLDSAQPMIDYKLAELAAVSNLKDNLGRKQYLERAIEILKPIAKEVELDLYLSAVSKTGGVSTEAIKRILGDTSARTKTPISLPDLPKPSGNKYSRAEEAIVAALVQNRITPKWEDLLDVVWQNNFHKKVFEVIRKSHQDKKQWRGGDIFDHLTEGDEDETSMAKSLLDYELGLNQTDLERLWQDSLNTMRELQLDNERKRLEELHRGEEDTTKRTQLLMQINDVIKRKKSLWQKK